MPILIPALVLGGLGLILGALIYVVSVVFHVEVDENLAKLNEMMPGYNCGACGQPGCSGLAKEIFEGRQQPTACKPMKKEQAEVIKEFMKAIKEN